MKKFKEVEADRRKYHADPTVNTVHRASLLVPEIPGTAASVSFLNHFLIKRKYPKVGCKVTAIASNGKRILAKLHEITEERVYSIPLTGMCEAEVSTYMVEFFAGENLFIPFPAVMVNHLGDGFLNQVHSFNRVLNDVFEDDAINANHQKEASIDLVLNAETDTFLLFMAGPFDVNDLMQVEVFTDGKIWAKDLPLKVKRFGWQRISVKEAFAELPVSVEGALRVRQPKQTMFYGRLLAGHSRNGAFSANHSYYDSSETHEYWEDDEPSSRPYPFFAGLSNKVIMHPIMSPCLLSLRAEFRGADGAMLADVAAGELKSPGAGVVEIDLVALAERAALPFDKISAFAIKAIPVEGKTPTRVNHQLIYGAGGLASSINMSLQSPHVYNPAGKQSFSWGQAMAGGDYDAFVGVVGDDIYSTGEPYECKATFYSARGKIAERNWRIGSRAGKSFSILSELADEIGPSLPRAEPIWFSVQSANFGLSVYSVSINRKTKNCSGEHGF